MTSDNMMEKMDQYWGRVTSRNKNYVFIELANGITAIAFAYAPLKTKVLCTVKRLADPDRGRYFPAVLIDSIAYDEYDEVCA